MAYVLGFFAADGTITVNLRGGEYFVVQISNQLLLRAIRAAMGSEHKISRRVHKKNGSVFHRLQIGSKEICADLRTLGMTGQKTYRLAMPHVPGRHLGEFIRGYFDGDGNVWVGLVHKNRKRHLYTIQTSFTSCSKNFLCDMARRLEHFGIYGSVCKKKDKEAFRLQYSKKSSILLYHLMYDWLQSDLYIEHKKNRFEKFLSKNAVVA